MSKSQWNAQLYNKFSKERIQPSIDLVNRIDNMRDLFLEDILNEIKIKYKKQDNGSVIFVFKRIFFIAYKL